MQPRFAGWSDRVAMLRRYGWHIAQCAVAAG